MSRISRAIVAVGYTLVLAVLVVDAMLVSASLRTIARSNRQVEQTRQFIAVLDRALSLLKDAETGQRGYLLTGRDEYLDPYRIAESRLGPGLDLLRSLTADDARQRARVDDLARLAAEKLAELRQTVELRREKGLDAALAVVLTDRGKDAMDRARRIAAGVRAEEERRLSDRTARSEAAVGRTVVTFAATTGMALLLLVLVSYLQRVDAAEREKAATALRESEAWLATTLTSIGDALIATDDRGRVRFLNPVAEALTGWPHREAEGRTMQEVFAIINETTRLPVENPVARVLREGTVVGLANHTVLIARDGTETPIDDSASPIKDEDGGVAGVVLVFRDITARKREEDARAEQNRLAEFGRDVGLALTEGATTTEMLDRCARATVAHLDGAFSRIWTLAEGADVLELRASAGMYTHLDGGHARVPVGQYKIGLIAQERRPHLTNAVIGDPRVPAQDWAEHEGMVAFAGYPLVVEDRLVGVWALFARHPLSEATLGAMESVARGIALGIERKRAEEALAESERWLATTLASIGDALIATDGQGLVRFLNPVAEALTGWSPSEAAGRPIEEVFRIVHEQTRAPAEHPVARVLREGTVVGLANHSVLIARDGTEWPIEDSAAPIRDPRGATAGVVMVFRDVTEPRAAQRLLRESEGRKAAILQTALDAIITMDHEGRIVEFNPSAERIFGHDRDAILGRSMADLIIPPALREAHRRGMADHLAGGAGPILGKRIEILALRADGAEFPVELAVTRISTDGPPLFTAHVRDIGERKRVEAERLRLIAIIEHSPDFIGLADADRRVIFVNQAGRRLVGLDGDDAVAGTSVLDYFPDDERDRIEREIIPVLTAEGHWDGEVRFRNFATGARVPVMWNIFTIPDPGSGRTFFACVSRDVTERNRDEQRLGFLAESGISLASSLDYKVTLGNIARLAVHGFAEYCYFDLAVEEGDRIERAAWAHADPRRQAEMDRIRQFVPPRRSEGDPVAETIATGRTRFVPEVDDAWLRRTAPDPAHYEYLRGLGLSSLICVPVPSRGRIVGALTFCHDDPARHFNPSDLRLAEDLGRRAGVSLHNALLYREAEEANRAKDQFLAVLSHELRTPLNPILLAVTSMLERPTPPEDVRPNLEMIRQYVNLQARLIDDLLDVMRIVRGKMPLHWEVADCHMLIRRALQVCRSDVLGKELRLDLDLAAEHHHINADPARLQQVFWNLLKNAVKFTPNGGTITVRSRNRGDGDARGDRLVVEVADTGIGIEPDVLPLIFDPFQQGESSITRKFGGLGLGLAICKGIVEGHGGLISVESPGANRGATFRIEMRALPEPRADDHGRPGDRADDGDGDAPPTRRNILLVEDEQATLRLMARLLRGLGHRVTTAGTITSALEAEHAGDFDLIVSDIGLPDGSGLELMRRVVDRRGPVPAIALTGYGMEEDIQRSRDAGFTAHMTKPIDFTKLEMLIRQIAP